MDKTVQNNSPIPQFFMRAAKSPKPKSSLYARRFQHAFEHSALGDPEIK